MLMHLTSFPGAPDSPLCPCDPGPPYNDQNHRDILSNIHTIISLIAYNILCCLQEVREVLEDQVDQKDLFHQVSRQVQVSHPCQVLLGVPWRQLGQKGLEDRRAHVGREDLGDLEPHHYHLFPNGDKYYFEDV